jgi:hypothetical protein
MKSIFGTLTRRTKNIASAFGALLTGKSIQQACEG